MENYQLDRSNTKGLMINELEVLNSLISIDSQSRNIIGVQTAQNFVGNILKSLGANVTYTENKLCPSANLLIAEIGNPNGPIINLICHTDTTLPNRQGNGILIDGNKLKGIGIADDKAGVVIAIKIFEYYSKKKISFRLRLISSPSEETGSIGWHDTFQELGKNAFLNLGLEPAINNGNLISSRNGNRWYEINVIGKSAHSGRFEESSINAAHEIGRMISQFHLLNCYEEKIKVNIGSVKAGSDSFNIVSGNASAKLDVRFPSFKARDQLHVKIREIIENSKTFCFLTGESSINQWELKDDCPPMPIQSQSIAFAKKFSEIASDLERIKIDHQHSGGAADINYFATENNANLDGLGAIGEGLHTVSEFILESSLRSRFEALKNSIELFSIEYIN